MSDDDRLQYMVDDALSEITELRSTVKEIFMRLNELEKRMAQVVVIAAAIAVVIPVLIESILKS